MKSETRKAKSKKISSAKVGIPPRHIDFDLTDAKKYFYDDNATASTFFALLSGAFPPGELFFMESVRNYRDKVTSAEQKAEISGFMGQEAIHTREHNKLNELFSSQGMEMDAPEKATEFIVKLIQKLPNSTQLAATTFMEHFTALLAEQLLTDEEFIKKADPEMIKLWQWHALEELEHKAVAYDLYEIVGNSRTERALAVGVTFAALLPMLGVTWTYMLAKDGQLGNVKDNLHGLNLLLGRKGFVTRILPKLPAFVKKGFHPKKHDTKNLEEEWREKLFGTEGELVGEFSNRENVLASM